MPSLQLNQIRICVGVTNGEESSSQKNRAGFPLQKNAAGLHQMRSRIVRCHGALVPSPPGFLWEQNAPPDAPISATGLCQEAASQNERKTTLKPRCDEEGLTVPPACSLRF